MDSVFVLLKAAANVIRFGAAAHSEGDTKSYAAFASALFGGAKDVLGTSTLSSSSHGSFWHSVAPNAVARFPYLFQNGDTGPAGGH